MISSVNPLSQSPKVSCFKGHVEAAPGHKVPVCSRKIMCLMVCKTTVLLDTALMCSKRCKSIQFCKGKRFQEYKIKWQPHKLFVSFQFFGDYEWATGVRHIKFIIEINNKHIYMFCMKYCLWVKREMVITQTLRLYVTNSTYTARVWPVPSAQNQGQPEACGCLKQANNLVPFQTDIL